ncbi:MAG: hypothetical protein KAW52_09185 [candidate division Zixibacteria bacterium]|nr:hypothetical protein [candidate division Zixibacteria bacterium]
MTEWEQRLPPRVRERLAKIKITPEEKKRLKADEKLKSFLSAFYRGEISPEDLGQQLEQYETKEKGFFISEVQRRLIDSLSLQIPAADFKKRGRCLLILERLKEKERDMPMKTEINALGSLIKHYLGEKNRVQEDLRKQVEQNPQLRMGRAKTDLGEMRMELSVDEAVSNSPQWKDFIFQHEMSCRAQFDQSIRQLKEMIE